MWDFQARAVLYGPFSPSNLPSVGLCFTFDSFLRLGSRRVAGGMPNVSRAISFTALTARNDFFFFLGISQHLRTDNAVATCKIG